MSLSPGTKLAHYEVLELIGRGGMDADDKVARMVKVWNASWALRELGWA